MRRAKSGAVSAPIAQPRRNFTVTGCATAARIARTMEAASPGSLMSAEPSPFDTILRAGHPMLTSRYASDSPISCSIQAACAAMVSGSWPNSWTATWSSPGARASRWRVFSLA